MSYSDALKAKNQHAESEEDISDNRCAICFETLDGNCNKATIDCGHSFHYKCIFRWNSKIFWW